MIEILREMFLSNPDKSTIRLKDKCLECGREATVNISPTSGGFGLQGGALLKNLSNGYLLKCSDCYQATSRIDDK